MDQIKQRISSIVDKMEFDRKTRVTKKEKEAFSRLSDDVGRVKKDLDKLNLRLWNCVFKGDYHSLSLSEAQTKLRKIYEDIGEILLTIQ